jgi:hypothetical protein
MKKLSLEELENELFNKMIDSKIDVGEALAAAFVYGAIQAQKTIDELAFDILSKHPE